MADFTFTSGADTVVGGPADDTVYATAATLNAGDSLTGGAGTDVLALAGSGDFYIDQLATFTGFERITLDNATNSFAQLSLGSQPIEVDATGNLSIYVNSSSNWNGSEGLSETAKHGKNNSRTKRGRSRRVAPRTTAPRECGCARARNLRRIWRHRVNVGTRSGRRKIRRKTEAPVEKVKPIGGLVSGGPIGDLRVSRNRRCCEKQNCRQQCGRDKFASGARR